MFQRFEKGFRLSGTYSTSQRSFKNEEIRLSLGFKRKNDVSMINKEKWCFNNLQRDLGFTERSKRLFKQ